MKIKKQFSTWILDISSADSHANAILESLFCRHCTRLLQTRRYNVDSKITMFMLILNFVIYF